MKISLYSIIALILLPISVSANSHSDICNNISMRYSSNSVAFNRIAKRIKKNFNITCNPDQHKIKPSITNSSEVGSLIEVLRNEVRSANGSMTLFSEAQALTNALT